MQIKHGRICLSAGRRSVLGRPPVIVVVSAMTSTLIVSIAVVVASTVVVDVIPVPTLRRRSWMPVVTATAVLSSRRWGGKSKIQQIIGLRLGRRLPMGFGISAHLFKRKTPRSVEHESTETGAVARESVTDSNELYARVPVQNSVNGRCPRTSGNGNNIELAKRTKAR
jgi:hypothetical protein